MQLYAWVDGILATTVPYDFAFAFDVGPLAVGRVVLSLSDGQASAFPGSLSDLMVWRRYLWPQEIRDVYSGVTVESYAQVLWLKLNDTANATVPVDASPLHQSLVMRGTLDSRLCGTIGCSIFGQEC